MEENNSNQTQDFQSAPKPAEHFPHGSRPNGTILNASEPFRTVPQASEKFGTVPKLSEDFRTIPQTSERKENHTLTVREVARMFEDAGVARTERSIVNWCQRIGNDMPRLDSYFDTNERKYYITTQSVERAIQEEKDKITRSHNSIPEQGKDLPKTSERNSGPLNEHHNEERSRLKDLEREVMDLKITNKAKDYFLEELQKDRERFVIERGQYVERLIESNRKVGELETKLLQLNSSPRTQTRKLEVNPDRPRNEGYPIVD